MGNVLVLSSPLPAPEMIRYLNSSLDGIIFHSHAEVNESFNPRYAVQRWYRYIIPTVEIAPDSFAISSSGSLIKFDIVAAREAASNFIGTHDFTSFSKLEPGKKPFREITSISINLEKQVRDLPPMVIIDVMGESFLWMMVRFIIGSVIHVLAGSWSNDTILELLKNPDSKRKPKPVKPDQLILMDVEYDNVNFIKIIRHNEDEHYIHSIGKVSTTLEMLRWLMN